MSRIRRALLHGVIAVLASVVGAFLLGQAAQASPATTIMLTIDQRQALVNGEAVTLDTAPVLDRATGRTFVPVRFIGETLGAYIGWSGAEQKVTYLTGDTRISLWIGRQSAEVDGREVALDAAPYIDANGRTLVPVRFVSEQMGAQVTWDGGARAVTVAAPWVGRLITIQDHTFTIANLDVAAGTRVTWVNLDSSTHNVYNSGFESPDLEEGQAYSHTFSEAGVFTYDCLYHDNMTATVSVH